MPAGDSQQARERTDNLDRCGSQQATASRREKEASRLDPEHKELLARGRVFCKVILTPVFAHGGPRDAAFWGTDPVWFQIARMQFSPYTPRLHRMLEIAPEDEQFQMANAAGDETVLKAIS